MRIRSNRIYQERLGQNIRQLRLQKEWTQEHLGGLVNRSRAAISRIEKGADLPSSELPHFVQVFGLSSVADLLEKEFGLH